MATVTYSDFSWTSTEGSEMAPGDTHYWLSYPFSYGDVINLMAHSVSGDPGAPVRELIVENVYTAVDTNGQRTVVFNVRNNGAYSIPGYLVGHSVINK
jgi:hypothetical protein